MSRTGRYTRPIPANRLLEHDGVLHGHRNGYMTPYVRAPREPQTAMSGAGFDYDNQCEGGDCGCPRCRSMGYAGYDTPEEKRAYGTGLLVGIIAGAVIYRATRR